MVNNKKPRIRLINKLTLVVLTLTSLWALWLVAPTKTMLIQLIARSASPEVSLAFLQQLNVNDPNNRHIILQMIRNYAELGDFNKANQLIPALLAHSDENTDWDTMDFYLSLLLKERFQQDPVIKKHAAKEINVLFSSITVIPDAIFARQFADAAIALSMPKQAFDFLYPHRHSTQTNAQELVSLALQSANYKQAMAIQLDEFHHDETIAQADALFALLVKTYQPQRSREFLQNYDGPLHDTPDFLKASIGHSKLMGNQDIVLKQSTKLLSVQPDSQLFVDTSKIAIALGEINLAKKLLLDAQAFKPQSQNLQMLHDIYRWQGDITEAQAASIQLLKSHPTEMQIRDGIDESSALGDIYYEGIFYRALAKQDHIQPSEYTRWLNALEKAEGTDEALLSVQQLMEKRPHDSALISNLARLYDYKSDYPAIINEWKKLKVLRDPTFNEATRIANAYIMTNQPRLALNVLTQPKNWLNADNDYLEEVSSLAWDTSNREISEQIQQQLVNRSDRSLDVYRYISIMTPLTDNDIDHIIQLYRNTGELPLLLAAIRAAYDAKNIEQARKLLNIASDNPVLAKNIEVMMYQAQLAQLDNQHKRAKQLYLAILQQDPNQQQAANNLLWIAIEENDTAQLKKLYNQYKVQYAGNHDFWLAFASASQQLGNYRDADIWYNQLLKPESTPDASIVLNYASLLEQQGQAEKAYRLRRYIASRMSKSLLALPDGDVSYRSLVALFMGDKFARQMIEIEAFEHPSAARTAELFQHYLASNQVDNIITWQQRTALGHYQLPDWEQLSLAIRQKDQKQIKSLLERAVNLPPADKNMALQFIGQHQQAWQQGQEQLGQITDKDTENQLRRQHVLQHPNKTHSLRSQLTEISHWNVTRFSLDYYSPHHNGYWRLGSDYQHAGTPKQLRGNDIKNESRIRGSYAFQQQNATWIAGFDLANGMGDQRLGIKGEYRFVINDYWQADIKLGLNNHIEASELLNLAGQENLIGLSANYQPTARESVALQLNYHDVSTRFNDDIGKGWDLNLRMTEQVFFADPGWQLYGDISMHEMNLSNKPLTGINSWNQSGNTLTSGDFIEDKYQRLAIGQRLSHGDPGIPGPTVPSPRYWFDTSLGYNVTNSQIDVTMSAGLGWRIIGNDELYVTTDWQSQDRNGDESLKLTLGYYYSF
ncbi:tetratricopeptide repeat protein [Photobacterium nomapromontoriensis]|uniref:tetratricopeptide repeat protein n=1 Tax=Photobacterium nomapromontoriensis TaxID=2910237 RepID=UPI003D11B800